MGITMSHAELFMENHKQALPEELKKQLKEYFHSQVKHGHVRGEYNISIWKAFYELEEHVHNLRHDFDSQVQFDHTLSSPNVVSSFDYCEPSQFHRPLDYQYPYLFWLFDHYKEGAPLIGLINSFFNSIKDKLNYPDIVLTETGVTRCKTNLRLCTNTLREWGILLRTDDKNKRSFGLSSFGMLLIAYLKFEAKSDPFSTLNPHFTLQSPGKFSKISIDSRIVDAYYHLKRKEGFDSLLDKIKVLDLTAEERKAFVKYKDQFIDLFLESIQLRKSGIKQTEKDQAVISKFVQKTERSKEFKMIKEKLQNYFTAKNG